MDATLQLWLEAAEYEALILRLEAERRATREAEERILAAWAEEDARGRGQQLAA